MKTLIISIGYILFIGLVILLSDEGTCGIICSPAKILPYGDKLGHFGLLFLLAAAVNCVCRGRQIQIFRTELALGSMLVFLFITAEEASQIWCPLRTPDVFDLLASTLGICSFELVRHHIAEHGIPGRRGKKDIPDGW